MAVATLATLLAFLPGLSTRQVTVIALASSPADGDYTIELASPDLTLDVEAAAVVEDSDKSGAEVRDELLDGLDGSQLADVTSSGSRSIRIAGAELGVAVLVTVAAPTDGMTVTTIEAAGVPEDLLEHYLGMAKRLVTAPEWGVELPNGQALRALHLLDRRGYLEQYGVTQPGITGEAGPVVSTGLGPSSTSFAAPAAPPTTTSSDADLMSTQWGRMYAELWRGVRPLAAAPRVLRGVRS